MNDPSELIWDLDGKESLEWWAAENVRNVKWHDTPYGKLLTFTKGSGEGREYFAIFKNTMLGETNRPFVHLKNLEREKWDAINEVIIRPILSETFSEEEITKAMEIVNE